MSTKKKATEKGVAKALAAAKGGVKPRKKGKTKAPIKESKTKVSGGQEGPPMELSVGDLNTKETKVLAALNGKGSGLRPVMSISELVAECFGSRSKAQGNSWVRNSLRRLVRSGLVEKMGRGAYRVSEPGRKKLTRAA